MSRKEEGRAEGFEEDMMKNCEQALIFGDRSINPSIN